MAVIAVPLLGGLGTFLLLVGLRWDPFGRRRRAYARMFASGTTITSLGTKSSSGVAGFAEAFVRDAFRPRRRSTKSLNLLITQADVDTTAEQVFAQQGLFAVAGGVAGLLLGALLGGPSSVIGGVVGAGIGMLWPRMRLQTVAIRRSDEMVDVLADVADMLAILAGTRTLLESMRRVADVGRGALCERFARIVAEVRTEGRTLPAALRQAAQVERSPVVRRFFFSLAKGVESGADLTKTLDGVADDVRADYLRGVREKGERRRVTLLGVIIATTMPLLMVFVLFMMAGAMTDLF